MSVIPSAEMNGCQKAVLGMVGTLTEVQLADEAREVVMLEYSRYNLLRKNLHVFNNKGITPFRPAAYVKLHMSRVDNDEILGVK